MDEEFTPNPETQARLDAIGDLTLNQVKMMVYGRVSPDEAILKAAECVAHNMLGKPTLEVVAVGLTLTMLGLELYGKGHLTIEEKESD